MQGINKFYTEEGVPLKCPSCTVSILAFHVDKKIANKILAYTIKCSICNKELGQWSYELYNPCYRQDLINKIKWENMLNNILEEVESTPLPPPYTEEERLKIDLDFIQVKNKIKEPGYEMTLEDQQKVILHCRTFRLEQFILNQKQAKETKEKKEKQVKEPKEPKEKKTKKEKDKVLTTEEYKALLVETFTRPPTEAEWKQIERYKKSN